MRAGRLRQRITFQRHTQSLDGYGENVGTWSDLVTVWAGVEPVSGREFFASEQVQSDVTTLVVVRYSSEVFGVFVTDRIQHGANYYDIRSIIDVNSRGEELQFMCAKHSIQ